MEILRCPKCKSTHLVKDGGFILSSGDRQQQYRCKECNKTCTEGTVVRTEPKDETRVLIDRPPEEDYDYSTLRKYRTHLFEKRRARDVAKDWCGIRFDTAESIGLAFIGDPNVDDDGCNWPLLEQDTQTILETDGFYCGNLGDTTNNWVGRLTRLFADQSTTHSQAWVLAEGWLKEIAPKLLFMVRGNHDSWSGANDPLNWIMRGIRAIDESWSAKFALHFPDCEDVKVWVSHDFKGWSQWNPLHGPMKAHMHRGGQAHIYAAGHKHTWASFQVEDARNRVISYIRSRGYKFIDDYATVHDMDVQQYGASVTAIIQPAQPFDRRVTLFANVQEAAEYLTFVRSRQ